MKKGVVLMLMSIGGYVRTGQRFVRKVTSDPRLRSAGVGCGYFLAGFLFSAASLGHMPMPLPLALLCAGVSGWPSVLTALGGALGYRVFWGGAAMQGVAWCAVGLLLALALGGRKLSRHMPLLMPILAGFTVAVVGLGFRLWLGDTTPTAMYLLRIGLAVGATRVFVLVLERRDPVVDWLACGLAVLALAQVAPIPALGLGFLAAGMLGAKAPFPAAALAGLALDLAQVTPVPMTAVMSLAFLLRLAPGLPKWVSITGPAAMYLVVAPLCGVRDWTAVLPLALGSGLGLLLPPQTPIAHRRGETGMAQVRLELAAEAMAQTQQLLLEVTDFPIDEGALVSKAAQRACGTCPCRKSCHEQTAATRMPTALLHRPLVTAEDLPVDCRKRGRLLLELRRSQDQFRTLRADRDKQREYRGAMVQQYQFLCQYLRELADRLPRRGEERHQHYRPVVQVCSAGVAGANGDRCLWFAGTELKYYVLLCDGMGTGTGAEAEGKAAASMLKRLLCAGYPAEYALRSLNSLCILRQRSGAVTVDLAEIDLEKGKVSLYKWGAAVSYLLSSAGAEKIGTAGAPPGLAMQGTRETVDKLSLRRGETLVLLSDGVDGEAAMRRAWELKDLPPGELAAKVLQYGKGNGSDDATAATIRLYPTALST